MKNKFLNNKKKWKDNVWNFDLGEKILIYFFHKILACATGGYFFWFQLKDTQGTVFKSVGVTFEIIFLWSTKKIKNLSLEPQFS